MLSSYPLTFHPSLISYVSTVFASPLFAVGGIACAILVDGSGVDVASAMIDVISHGVTVVAVVFAWCTCFVAGAGGACDVGIVYAIGDWLLSAAVALALAWVS